VNVRRRRLDHHVDVEAAQPVPLRLGHLQTPAAEVETAEPLLERGARHAEVERGGEEHVAGDAAHRLQVQHPLAHRRPRRDTSAA
jgi:hypothetical protein